jgi:hypothetical protein
MASPSDNTQRKAAFFHSVNKIMTLDTQANYESIFSSGHVIQTKNILASALPYLTTESAVDAWIVSNPGILKKYDMFSLTEVAATNGQSWHINDGGVWQKPFIHNTLISNNANNPAYGYIFELYRNDNSRIGEGVGRWWVDPYQGIVRFDTGFTPSDQGYGIPKIKCYVYIGKTLTNKLSEIDNDLLTHTHDRVNTHKITVNNGAIPTSIISFDVWVEIE